MRLNFVTVTAPRYGDGAPATAVHPADPLDLMVVVMLIDNLYFKDSDVSFVQATLGQLYLKHVAGRVVVITGFAFPLV